MTVWHSSRINSPPLSRRDSPSGIAASSAVGIDPRVRRKRASCRHVTYCSHRGLAITGILLLSVRHESWRDPAGASPARVSRSGRSVVSVAGRKVTTVAKRTQQSLRGGLLSRERVTIAEAEAVDSAEGKMSSAVMRGAAALPWSKTPSRTKGSHRNVGEFAIGRTLFCRAVRAGKAMSHSRR